MELLVTLLTFAIALCALGQPATIAVEDHQTHEQIQSWLLSNDPRLVSWGANFAREQNDTSNLNLARQLVQQIPSSSSKDQENAQFAIVDALIQRNVEVPLNTIAGIAPHFPAQAAILASRLPVSEASPLLLGWFTEHRSANEKLLSKIAGMLLSHAPPPGLAASALNQEEVTLAITVVSPAPNGGIGSGLGPGCGDSLGTKRDPMWPPIYTYSLAKAETARTSPLLAEASGERIAYLRHEIHSGWGECYSDWSDYAATIHHIIAQILSVPDGQLRFKTYDYASIEWANNDQFSREAEQGVIDEEAKFSAVAEALYEKQFLTAEERINARPKLSVMVEDQRDPKGPPLSELHFSNPRTVLVPPPLPFEDQMRKILDTRP